MDTTELQLKIPFHVAIIPDGNRRFARRLLETPSKGHEWGVGKMKELFNWCQELGVKVATLYVLSLENLKNRSKEEVDFLLYLARKELGDIVRDKKHFVHKDRIRMQFIGNLQLLPADLRETIELVKKRTEKYSGFFINLAVAYGGRQEIVEACKRIGERVAKGLLAADQINEQTVKESLQTNGFPYPDMVLRTGGEKRLSNFLLFQNAYAELVFTETLWPELTKEQFFAAVREFGERERRFGK